MKLKQTITALVAFLLTMLMLVSAANYALAITTAPQYVLDGVEVNGHKYLATDETGGPEKIEVRRGDTLNVEVFYHGIGTGTNDARASVELVGYEFDSNGEVRDTTGLFEIFAGAHSSKRLSVEIPEDIRATDDMKLRITLEDDDTTGFTKVYHLRLEEQRHAVNTFDVILNPPGHVQPGQPLFVTARVENLGGTVEDSIKVTASIPALGVQASEFVDVLDTESNVRLDDEERHIRDAATTNDLLLMIPEDAKPGEYLLSVVVQYNRFHSKQEKILPIVIEGPTASQTTQPRTLVSVDNAAQRAEAGKGVVFKVSVANLEGAAKTYSAVVSGVGSWASFRVDPLARTVAPDQTAEFNVYVSPADGAPAGMNTFTVTVQDETGKVAGQQSLSLEITPAMTTLTSANLKRALEIGFVVLLVILVILGIVIIAKKLAGEDEEDEGKGRVAKKSYY